MFIAVQLFQSNTASLLSPSTTVMKLPAAAAAQLLAAIGASGNFTTFSLSNGVVSEIVYATGVSGVNVTIQRAQEGTTAQTFSAGTIVRFVWTEVSIQDIASGGSTGISITGGGQATVTGGPFNWNITVPAGNLSAGTGISVTGTWPNITITNTSPGGGGGGITTITGSGQAIVTAITGGFNVNVPTPTLSAGAGIAISGTWPALTITNSAPAVGGTGTVTSVAAGSGIAITGDPTVNPTISLSPSGVTAGTYGGIAVDTFGRVTNITAGLITSVTSLNTSLVVGTPTLGSVTLNIIDSTTAAKGIIQKAVNTAAASSNAADTTTCVTPSGVAAVLAAQTPVTIIGDTANIPLASSAYTTSLIISSTALNLVAGKTALVTVTCEMQDSVVPTNIPNFGIGLFSGATFLDGISDNVPSAVRTLTVKIVGPFTGVVRAATTAPAGTFTVQSKSITVVSN